MGCPSEEFPRPWSVYRWISGEPASTGQVADPAGFASGLAGFLAALQAIDASDGPPAGRHNFFRGGPLAKWDEQTRQLIMEWTFFTGDSAAAFRRGLLFDEATWARGRGWALWKASSSPTTPARPGAEASVDQATRRLSHHRLHHGLSPKHARMSQ
jgi:aminoglycoside phosphotransferase (APT) family kinase protein